MDTAGRVRFNDLGDRRAERIQSVAVVADAYLADYEVRHRSIGFAKHALRHVNRHLGKRLVVDISEQSVKTYQIARLKEGAAPKTINDEVGFLLRLLGSWRCNPFEDATGKDP